MDRRYIGYEITRSNSQFVHIVITSQENFGKGKDESRWVSKSVHRTPDNRMYNVHICSAAYPSFYNEIKDFGRISLYVHGFDVSQHDKSIKIPMEYFAKVQEAINEFNSNYIVRPEFTLDKNLFEI